MFARSVTMHIRPSSVADLNKTIEKEVVPLLQKQKGFRDELVLVASNGTEVLGISLWEQKADAETYQRTAFPEVQRMLSKVVEGTPQVQNYDVSHSTIHKAATSHA